MSVTSYDSIDALFKALNKAMIGADSRVKSWQKAIIPGDFFLQHTEYGFDIFGKVLKMHLVKRLENYIIGHCYSIACPNGEIGDVHISVISAIIDKDQFEQAREDGWQWDPNN